jgi:hypothetical protein
MPATLDTRGRQKPPEANAPGVFVRARGATSGRLYFLKLTETVIWSPFLLVSSTLVFVPELATLVEPGGLSADQ